MSNDVNLGFGVVHDNMNAFLKAFAKMQAKEVVAGFPQNDTPREDEEGNPSPITNAAIAYVQNTGMPELNIPARPFMNEGVEDKREPIAKGMEAAGLAALDGNAEQMDRALHAVGLIAKSGIQSKINDGPFDPLSEATLKARAARGRKGAGEELDRRAAGEDPGVELARPLVDTGQLRNAVEYAVREK